MNVQPFPVPHKACTKFHLLKVLSLSSPNTWQLNTALYNAWLGSIVFCCGCRLKLEEPHENVVAGFVPNPVPNPVKPVPKI